MLKRNVHELVLIHKTLGVFGFMSFFDPNSFGLGPIPMMRVYLTDLPLTILENKINVLTL